VLGEVDYFVRREEGELRFSGFFSLESRSCLGLIVDIGDGKMTSLNSQSKILVCERHGLG